MVEVRFTLDSGQVLIHQGEVGSTLLDVALDNGVPGIIGQCGGGMSCCTCHCWIAEFDQIESVSQDELDLLEYAWGLRDNSRLACQVKLTDLPLNVEVPSEQS